MSRVTPFLRSRIFCGQLACLDAGERQRVDRLAARLRCNIVAYDPATFALPYPSDRRHLCRMAVSAPLDRKALWCLARLERRFAGRVVLVAYRRPWRLRLPGVAERRALAR